MVTEKVAILLYCTSTAGYWVPLYWEWHHYC